MEPSPKKPRFDTVTDDDVERMVAECGARKHPEDNRKVAAGTTATVTVPETTSVSRGVTRCSRTSVVFQLASKARCSG